MIQRFKLQAPSALTHPTHALFRVMRLTFLSAATDKVALSGSRRLLACLPTETVLLPDGRGTRRADRKEGEHTVLGDLLRHD